MFFFNRKKHAWEQWQWLNNLLQRLSAEWIIFCFLVSPKHLRKSKVVKWLGNMCQKPVQKNKRVATIAYIFLLLQKVETFWTYWWYWQNFHYCKFQCFCVVICLETFFSTWRFYTGKLRENIFTYKTSALVYFFLSHWDSESQTTIRVLLFSQWDFNERIILIVSGWIFLPPSCKLTWA